MLISIDLHESVLTCANLNAPLIILSHSQMQQQSQHITPVKGPQHKGLATWAAGGAHELLLLLLFGVVELLDCCTSGAVDGESAVAASGGDGGGAPCQGIGGAGVLADRTLGREGDVCAGRQAG